MSEEAKASGADRPWSSLVIKPYFRMHRSASQPLTPSKGLSHDDFAYRIRMISLENMRLPRVGSDRSASQHAHCNPILLTVLSLSPPTLRDTRNGESGMRPKQTRLGP